MWKRYVALSMSLAFWGSGAISAEAADFNKSILETTQTAILSSLQSAHPRIIANEEDFEAVRSLLQSNPNGPAWLKKLQDSGEAIIKAQPVEHKLEGPRLLSQSRAALDRITLLGFLHRVQPDPRYVERVVLEMETACAFPDWNPSHFLDTAEMTAAMAIGYDWFYDDLTTNTRETVQNAIVNLGLQEGLKVYDAKPHWINGHNNWNQVCNGGMIIGALAIADIEPEIAAEILRRGKQSLSKGMQLFEPDGGWVEAPSYWIYTMKYTSRVLSALRTALGTAFGLDEGQGFSKTGDFILAMEGPTGQFFNWGDCGEAAGNLPEMFWLAGRFDKPVYATAGANHMHSNPGPLDLLWYQESDPAALSDEPLDWYFRETEAASMRENWNDPKAAFAAFKGGDNTAPHSNLDLGSFVFDSGGERWAVELGGDNYNLPGYWNLTKRLAYYRINSFGQNVLTFDGKNQNPKAKSKIIRRGSDPDSAFAVVDLDEAYAGTAVQAERGFSLLDNRKHCVIQDEFETTGAVELTWTMHTRAKAEINGRSITLSQGQSTATLTVLEPVDGQLFVESAGQKSPQATNEGVLRVGVKHHHSGGSGRVIIQLSSGDKTNFIYEPRPLENW